MNIMISKRGLSTIVITLIIIVLSLVAVGIAWVVVSNLLKTQGEQATDSFGHMFISLDIQRVVQNQSGDVNVIVQRNAGPGELIAIKFVVEDGVNSTVIQKSTNMTELGSNTFILSASEIKGAIVKEVSIFSVMKSKGKEITGGVEDTFKIDSPYTGLFAIPPNWTEVIFDSGNSGTGWSDTEITSNDNSNIHGIWGDHEAVSKTFNGLPAHTEMKIEAIYYAIDSWDSESGYLYVDQNLIWLKQRTTYNSCTGWAEYTIGPAPWGNIRCKEAINTSSFDHSSSSVTISFDSNVNQAESDESWGFDNLRIYVK
jgi:hypothetical protein